MFSTKAIRITSYPNRPFKVINLTEFIKDKKPLSLKNKTVSDLVSQINSTLYNGFIPVLENCLANNHADFLNKNTYFCVFKVPELAANELVNSLKNLEPLTSESHFELFGLKIPIKLGEDEYNSPLYKLNATGFECLDSERRVRFLVEASNRGVDLIGCNTFTEVRLSNIDYNIDFCTAIKRLSFEELLKGSKLSELNLEEFVSNLNDPVELVREFSRGMSIVVRTKPVNLIQHEHELDNLIESVIMNGCYLDCDFLIGEVYLISIACDFEYYNMSVRETYEKFPEKFTKLLGILCSNSTCYGPKLNELRNTLIKLVSIGTLNLGKIEFKDVNIKGLKPYLMKLGKGGILSDRCLTSYQHWMALYVLVKSGFKYDNVEEFKKDYEAMYIGKSNLESTLVGILDKDKRSRSLFLLNLIDFVSSIGMNNFQHICLVMESWELISSRLYLASMTNEFEVEANCIDPNGARSGCFVFGNTEEILSVGNFLVLLPEEFSIYFANKSGYSLYDTQQARQESIDFIGKVDVVKNGQWLMYRLNNNLAIEGMSDFPFYVLENNSPSTLYVQNLLHDNVLFKGKSLTPSLSMIDFLILNRENLDLNKEWEDKITQNKEKIIPYNDLMSFFEMNELKALTVKYKCSNMMCDLLNSDPFRFGKINKVVLDFGPAGYQRLNLNTLKISFENIEQFNNLLTKLKKLPQLKLESLTVVHQLRSDDNEHALLTEALTQMKKLIKPTTQINVKSSSDGFMLNGPNIEFKVTTRKQAILLICLIENKVGKINIRVADKDSKAGEMFNGIMIDYRSWTSDMCPTIMLTKKTVLNPVDYYLIETGKDVFESIDTILTKIDRIDRGFNLSFTKNEFSDLEMDLIKKKYEQNLFLARLSELEHKGFSEDFMNLYELSLLNKLNPLNFKTNDKLKLQLNLLSSKYQLTLMVPEENKVWFETLLSQASMTNEFDRLRLIGIAHYKKKEYDMASHCFLKCYKLNEKSHKSLANLVMGLLRSDKCHYSLFFAMKAVEICEGDKQTQIKFCLALDFCGKKKQLEKYLTLTKLHKEFDTFRREFNGL